MGRFFEGHLIPKNFPITATHHLTLEINLGFDWDDQSSIKWSYDLTGESHWPDLLVDSSDAGIVNDRITQSLSIFLTLYLRCLQWSGLPIFDLPKILELKAIELAQEKYKLTLSVNAVDHLNPIIDEIAFQKALTMMRMIHQFSPTVINRQKLHHFIDTSVIPALSKYIPAGRSTVPVLRVAHELGIPFRHLGLGVYQLGWGSRAKRLMYSVSDCDSAIGQRLSRNKVATAELLKRCGLPIPQQSVVNAREQLSGVMSHLSYPVVCKPIDGARGEGVTIDINNFSQLENAYDHASNVGKNEQVLFENQVPGVCHRIFVTAGKMLYAVLRGPVAIVGDGKQSITELIYSEQLKQAQLPWGTGIQIPNLDQLSLRVLRDQGFQPKDVPSCGRSVALRKIESTQWGGIDTDVTKCIHPANVDIAIRAAQVLGLDMAGVDIISTDISRPWYETGAVINEVNFSPLLGGAEISRSYLKKFFEQFIIADGKIPVQTYALSSQARQGFELLLSQGLRAYLINGHGVFGPNHQVCHLIHVEMQSQLDALLCRLDVDAIVIESTESIS